MSEVVGGFVRRPLSAPVNYVEQKEPYMRKQNKKYDKEKWRDIKHENKIIESKLRRIQNEPPAVFHSPQSYGSIKPQGNVAAGTWHRSTQPIGQKTPPTTMPGHPHHVDVPPWPPKKCESYIIARQRHQRGVDEGNTRMFQKLAEVYGSRRPRSILNPGGVYQIDERSPAASADLAVEWAERTAIYLPPKTTHNNPLDPTYAHADYAAPDRPADRVLAALGVLPGQRSSTSTSPLASRGQHSFSTSPCSNINASSSARARRARHAQSARRSRPADADLSLELGGAAKAAAQARNDQGAALWAGRLGPTKGIQPPPSPQAGLTPQTSSHDVGSPPALSFSTSPYNTLQDPIPCVSPEPDVLITDAPPPDGWPGVSKYYRDSAEPPPRLEPPPRHPMHTSTASIMNQSEKRGYYASKGPTHSVPKSLGVAQCAGCSARSYYLAGGVRLSPCVKGCGQAFYCSETCARVDWPTHKPYCKWVTNGQWMQPGCRTSQQLWVANASLAAGRAQLKKKGGAARSQQSILGEIDAGEELEKAVRRARAREIEAEKRQAHVEYLAYHGMDGPRPCMYMGGKPI